MGYATALKVDAIHSRPVPAIYIHRQTRASQSFASTRNCFYRTHFLASGKSIWTSGAERLLSSRLKYQVMTISGCLRH